MKTLTILSFIILTGVISLAQEKTIGPTVPKLKGKVKTVSLSVYLVAEKDGNVVKLENQKTYKDEFQHYTENGLLLEEFMTELDGKVSHREILKYDNRDNIVYNRWGSSDTLDDFIYNYKYDKNGYKAEETYKVNSWPFETKNAYLNDDKGNVIKTTKYDVYGNVEVSEVKLKYDALGNVSERLEFNEKRDTVLMSIYLYDSWGRLIEGKSHRASDNWEVRFTFKYNDKGKKIEKKEFSPFETLIKKEMIKYDEKGNEIEKSNIAVDGITRLSHIYKYDNNGNRIEENDYDLNGVLEATYKYNEKGFKIEFIQYENGSNSNYGSTFKYDDYGNVIETVTYNLRGGNYNKKKYTCKYEYDIHKNWVKKIEFEDDVPMRIHERIITYY